MRLFLFIFFSLLLFSSCRKEEIKTADLITSFTLSPRSVEADGTSIITMNCELNEDAAEDKRQVVFKTNTGQFVENKLKEITKKAEFEGGKLKITLQIVAPIQAGTLKVTAEPVLPNSQIDYIASDSIIVTASVPKSIKVTANSFFVWSNYQSEVTITGTLFNQAGNKVSTGVNVLLEDYFPGGVPIGGRRREESLKSNSDSKVSVIYSPGGVPVGSDIWIKMTVLDALGNKTDIKDSVLLRVNL